MKTDLSLQQLSKSFSTFMHRYHVIVFSIVIVGGLSAATFALYQVTTTAHPDALPTPTSFDKKTMDRISELRGAGDTPEPLNLPSGRTNPFRD